MGGRCWRFDALDALVANPDDQGWATAQIDFEWPAARSGDTVVSGNRQDDTHSIGRSGIPDVHTPRIAPYDWAAAVPETCRRGA